MAVVEQARRIGFWTVALAILGCGLAPTGAHAQDAETPDCPLDRPVMFAGFDWQSARFHVATAKFILETAYGCETDDLPGSTIPLLTGLRRGEVDIAMEVWMDRASKVWDDGIEAGQVESLGVNMADATQAWYVPRYMIEGDAARGIEATAPDLRGVDDLKTHVSLFKDPERPRMGRFYNCILGWLCETNNTKKLRVYELDDAFTNFRPGTGAALSAAIASHYAKGEPFVAYYWDPSWVTARFDLVALEEPPYDQDIWDEFAASRRPDVATAYPSIEIHIGINTDFKEEAGDLLDFLKAYRTRKEDVRTVLLHMHENKDLEDREIAMWFLRGQPEAWADWLPEERRLLVEAALEET